MAPPRKIPDPNNLSLQSTSISQLMKIYKNYVQKQVREREDIIPLEEFYWSMKDVLRFKKYLVFEHYLREKEIKKTQLPSKVMEARGTVVKMPGPPPLYPRDIFDDSDEEDEDF